MGAEVIAQKLFTADVFEHPLRFRVGQRNTQTISNGIADTFFALIAEQVLSCLEIFDDIVERVKVPRTIDARERMSGVFRRDWAGV